MTDLTFYQEEALKIIALHTKDNPITGLQVAGRIHLKDRDSGKEGADMRSVVNALRSKGFPVCASGLGYYYARSKAELDEFADSFKGRIDKQMQAYSGLILGYDQIHTLFGMPADMIPVTRSGEPEPIGKILKKQQEWKFASKSKPGIIYSVCDFTSYLFCNCPAYNFRKRCTHTEQVEDEIRQRAIAPTEDQENQHALF